MAGKAAPTIRPLALPGDWIHDAACRDRNPEDWWPVSDDKPSPEAVALCRQVCPVQEECLRWAIENDETTGLWGGYTPAERAAIASEMGRRTPPTRCPGCGRHGKGPCTDTFTCDEARAKRGADV